MELYVLLCNNYYILNCDNQMCLRDPHQKEQPHSKCLCHPSKNGAEQNLTSLILR